MLALGLELRGVEGTTCDVVLDRAVLSEYNLGLMLEGGLLVDIIGGEIGGLTNLHFHAVEDHDVLVRRRHERTKHVRVVDGDDITGLEGGCRGGILLQPLQCDLRSYRLGRTGERERSRDEAQQGVSNSH